MADKEALFQSVSHLNEHLKKLNEQCDTFKDEVASQMEQYSAEEQARINCALVYSTHALLWIYFKTQGVPAAHIPSQKELARVQQYITRLDNIAKEPEQQKLKLNKEAADRFVKANITQNVSNQKTSGRKRARPESKGKSTKKQRK